MNQIQALKKLVINFREFHFALQCERLSKSDTIKIELLKCTRHEASSFELNMEGIKSHNYSYLLVQ